MKGKWTFPGAGFPFGVSPIVGSPLSGVPPIVGGGGWGRRLNGRPKGSTPTPASFFPGNKTKVGQFNDYHHYQKTWSNKILRFCCLYHCLRQWNLNESRCSIWLKRFGRYSWCTHWSNNPGRQSQAKGLSSFYRCHGGLIAISSVHMALATTGLRLKMARQSVIL